RVNHQLHAARFIEETLHDKRALGRDCAKDAMRAGKVFSQLPRSALRNARLGAEPVNKRPDRWESGRAGRQESRVSSGIPAFAFSHLPTFARARGEARFNILSQFRNRAGEFIRAARRFAQPERDAWRLAVRVFHADLARIDTENFPGSVPELKDISGQTFDREVFVDRADKRFGGFEDNAIIGVVWNSAA